MKVRIRRHSEGVIQAIVDDARGRTRYRASVQVSSKDELAPALRPLLDEWAERKEALEAIARQRSL